MATSARHKFTPHEHPIKAHTHRVSAVKRVNLVTTSKSWLTQREVCGGCWVVREWGRAWGKRRRRKMRVIMLKLALCEKVTNDLMLAVTSPCHRNQVIWQRPISSFFLLSSSFSIMCTFLFPVPPLLLKISKFLSLLDLKQAHVIRLGSKSSIVHPACSLMWRSRGENNL